MRMWTEGLPGVQTQVCMSEANGMQTCVCTPGNPSTAKVWCQLVHFGEAGDAAAYCCDHRDNREELSIIHWNDACWRRLAPDFDTFINRFGLLEKMTGCRV